MILNSVHRHNQFIVFFFLWRFGPTRAMASSFLRFLDHTQPRATIGRTPLDEWSARRRDLYLTTHNTHNRQTSMPPLGLEPTITAGERPQTYALDRATTGIGNHFITQGNYKATCFDYRLVILRPIFVNCATRCYAHFGIPSCLHPWNT